MTDAPMIALNPDIPRNRAVFAFHTLFGGSAKSEFFGLAIPASIRLADYNLIAAAGDTDQPLSFMALRPLAIEQGCDVIATWLAPMKSGHRFLFDLILHRDGAVTAYREYRLWLGKRGRMHFVPESGPGLAIMIGDSELRMKRLPFRDPIARLDGIARGQAIMQRLAYGGTTFSRPIDRYARF